MIPPAIRVACEPDVELRRDYRLDRLHLWLPIPGLKTIQCDCSAAQGGPMYSSARFLKSTQLLASLFIAVLFATNATAQQASAKIVGTVSDQQGAVVPGVSITVTNTATNVTHQTTTGKDGFYQILDLPIGSYRIGAFHRGFRPVEVMTAPLEINQSLRVDIELEVGAATERIEVAGQASGVEQSIRHWGSP